MSDESRPDGAAPVDLQEEWRGMQRRLVADLAGDQNGDLGKAPFLLDSRVYTDAARFDAERKRLFRDVPLLVAFAEELAAPGDRVLFDAAGPPILVVRGRDGVLRAFLNQCTHRAARLVSDCEPSRQLLCPFHGWVYDLDRRLRSVPHAAAFEGIDRERRGLTPVPVAEWGGMVFVRARPGDEPIDVEGFLGPIAPLLAALDLGRLRQVCADRIDVAANWKLALDMGREVYHVPVVHRDSLAPNLHPTAAIFDTYGRHNRFSGASRSLEALVGVPEAEWPETPYQAVHYLFPNTTLSFTHVFDGQTPVVTMSRVFPGESIGEGMTLMATYGRSDAPDVADEQVAAMHQAVLGIVGGEDYGAAASVWQTLKHGVAPPGLVLGRNETLVERYHRDVADYIGMPL